MFAQKLFSCRVWLSRWWLFIQKSIPLYCSGVLLLQALMCWNSTQLLHTPNALDTTNKELLRHFHWRFWPCSVKPSCADLHFHHQFTMLSWAKPSLALVLSRVDPNLTPYDCSGPMTTPLSPSNDPDRNTWDKRVLCLVYLRCSFSYLQMSIPLTGQGIPCMKIANWVTDKAWSWKISIHLEYGPRSHFCHARTKWLAEAALSSHITTVPPKNQPKVQGLLQFHKVDERANSWKFLSWYKIHTGPAPYCFMNPIFAGGIVFQGSPTHWDHNYLTDLYQNNGFPQVFQFCFVCT